MPSAGATALAQHISPAGDGVDTEVTLESALRKKHIALSERHGKHTVLMASEAFRAGDRQRAADLLDDNDPADIDALDAATLKDTVYQIVHDNDHVLSAAGPIWELPDYNYIRRRSYWLTR